MVRILRTSLCLLLALLLIFHVSPLRADAVAVSAGVAVGVGIGLAVAVGLQALGIRQGTDGAAFSSLVSDCAAALSPDWAIDGLTTMLALTSGGVTRTYASRDFLQSILDWLFDSGSLSCSEEYIFPYSSYENVMNAYNEIMAFPFHLICKQTNSTVWWFYGSDTELTVKPYSDGSGQYWIYRTYGPCDSYKVSNGSCEYFYQSAGGGSGSISEVYESGLVSDISTSSDLTLESVGQDVAADYGDYGSAAFEDDDGVPYLPVTIPSLSVDSFVDQTQADAQSGVTSESIVDELVNSQAGSDSETEAGSITDFLSKILDTVIGLPAAIGQAIGQVLSDIFVPSADFVTAKVEAIQARFSWISPIIDFAKSLQGAISGSEPPVIYVHLQNYEGPYNFGGSVKFLDMTWYSRYKSQGDAIISGFLWALLGWRLFMKLPSIINGAGGAVGSITYGRGKDD